MHLLNSVFGRNSRRIFYNFKILYILILLYSISCRFPVRHEQDLEEDRDFLFYPNQTIPISELIDKNLFNKNLNSLEEREANLNYQEKNNLFVLLAKDGNLEVSLTGFQGLIQSQPKEKIPLLNLIRLYYVIHEYEEARAYVRTYIQKNNTKLNDFKPILNELQASFRIEERAMILEGLSALPGYELYSWEELGKYFLFQKDFASAEYYLQKILSLAPFNEEALIAMAELCLDAKRWSELTDYGKAINLVPNKKRYSFYYIAKGYFERGKFPESIDWIQKAPDTEKANVEFLILWRDSLLAENPRNSLEGLRKYYKIVQSKGFEVPEAMFLPTNTSHGREIMEGFIQ